MKKPQIPADEIERLKALKSYQVLDTEEELIYDQLTKLAATICGTKISLVSLVDEKRQWFKSHHGIDAHETPRELAFCAHAVYERNILLVEDSTTDDRFHDNPLVTGDPRVIFYAGIPLIDNQGYALGTLCVIDNQPKKLNQEQIDSLKTIADQVIINFRLRRELKNKNEELLSIHNLSSQVPGVIYQYQLNIDGTSCFPFATKAIEDIYEVTPEEVKNDATIVFSRLHKEDYDAIVKSIQESANKLTNWELEYRVNLPKKGLRWLKGFARPMRLKNNDTLWYGFITDITSQKELEKQIEDQRLQMANSAKFASLGEMAGGIAHEINNPLAIISGKTSILEKLAKENKLDNEKLFDGLAKIHQTVDRISRIIKGLRTFSRNSENDNMSTASINDILNDTLELTSEKLKIKEIELKLNLNHTSKILCRPTQISQVFMNLISNSYDAIENHSKKWIEINSTDEGDFVKIQFKDSGSGISKDILDKIMQPFFTTKEAGKGTGLGLSITTGIIEQHKGKFFYDDKCANTCFTILLPAQKN